LSDSCELHVDVHEGSGPYALLVHGMLSSRAQWLLNLDALRTVCRPVVVELWGHGRSPAPAEAGPHTPEGYASEFERIRESLSAPAWLVIGQSLGAALTLRYALDHPERVIAQVFTNSSSALADEEWQQSMRTSAPRFAERIEKGGAKAVEAMPVHPTKARRMPEAVREQLVADAALLRPEAVARALLYTVSSVRGRVDENHVPTMLVTGAREAEFAEPRDFAKAHMPCTEVVDLDAGHAVNIQAADAFNEAVVEFFARHAAAR